MITHRVQLFSDLHLEHRKAVHYKELLERISATPAPELTILAGDVAPLGWLASEEGADAATFLRTLCKQRGRVVAIQGNHELYDCDALKEDELIDDALLAIGTFRYSILRRQETRVGNVRILGTRLYWPDPIHFGLRSFMTDYKVVQNLEPFAYEEAAKDAAWLREEVREGDVIVTHLMPSPKCIQPRFVGNPSNHFFVHNMEDVIVNKRPSHFLSGHTHEPYDFVIDKTRLLCNPWGYPGERQGKQFDPGCTFEV